MRGKHGFASWFGHHGHHGGNNGLKLTGTKADNLLTGGNLDDRLYGCSGDDTLDGGAGSDKVLGGRGNDVLLYSMAGNLGEGFANAGAHDIYDGGSGFDTLKLQLTYGEFFLDSVQADTAAFEAFLDAKANVRSDHGKTFHFQSFDLDARNFEDLDIELVNGAPVARADADKTDEDTPITIAPAKLLANDSDADHLDQIAVIDAAALSELGAVITIDAAGNLNYDPSDALALQQLVQGATMVDSFTYTIADLGGATATATVQITVTGVNDLPDALDDAKTVFVTTSSGGGQPDVRTITFEGATNPDYVDGFSIAGFTIFDMFGKFDPDHPDFTYMAAAGTTNDNTGGGFDADGAVRQVDGETFAVLSLSLASFFIEPTVRIEGYLGGDLVAELELASPDGVTAAYRTIVFDQAWSSIDELRFYGQTDDGSLDFILIDNLEVALSGGGSGSGTPSAGAVDIDVLANDTDADDGDVLALLTFDGTSAMGAAITWNEDDGTLHYDPSGIDLPVLAPGEKVYDSFKYTVSDGYGGTDVASVSIELLGADDASLLGSPSVPDVNLL